MEQAEKVAFDILIISPEAGPQFMVGLDSELSNLPLWIDVKSESDGVHIQPGWHYQDMRRYDDVNSLMPGQREKYDAARSLVAHGEAFRDSVNPILADVATRLFSYSHNAIPCIGAGNIYLIAQKSAEFGGASLRMEVD